MCGPSRSTIGAGERTGAGSELDDASGLIEVHVLDDRVGDVARTWRQRTDGPRALEEAAEEQDVLAKTCAVRDFTHSATSPAPSAAFRSSTATHGTT